MQFDQHQNLAQSFIAAVPADALSGTQFAVLPGDGDRFKPNSPVTLCPDGVRPTPDNAEIGYITNVDGDVVTVSRAQEGSFAQLVAVGWVIAATVTAKTLTDIEDASEAIGAVAAEVRAALTTHAQNLANPHAVTATQVGLGNVNNTSDAAKPVSTAQAAAIAAKASTSYVDAQDAAVASAANTALTAHTGRTDNPHATTRAQVGLGSVDNTSDLAKPVSTAMQAALDLKGDVTTAQLGTALLGYLPLTGGAVSGNLTIASNNPQLLLTETDQSAPAGVYRIDVQNDALRIIRSATELARFAAAGMVVTGNAYVSSSTGSRFGRATNISDETAIFTRTAREGDPTLSGGTVAVFQSNSAANFSASLAFIAGSTSNFSLYFGDAQSSTSGRFNYSNSSDQFSLNQNLVVTGSVTPGVTNTHSLGSAGLYWSNSFVTRSYLNATAYIDGATAGVLNATGRMILNVSTDQGLTINSNSDRPSLYFTGNTGTSSIKSSFGGTRFDFNPGDNAAVNLYTGSFMRYSAQELSFDTNNASATQTLKQTSQLTFSTKYWDGSASQYRPIGIRPLAVNTVGDYRLAFTMNNNETFTLAGNGNVGIGAQTPGERLEMVGTDVTLRLKNTGDAAGAFVGDTFASMQMGMYNPSGSTVGVVAAGGKRSFFGMGSDGRVGSLSNNFPAAAIYRNLLDDGLGNMEITQSTAGLILKDRSSGARYRLYMTGGVLSTEAL